MIVKEHDTVPLTLTIGEDITGATVRVLARRPGAEVLELPASVTNFTTGVIVHNLDGTLPVGNYDVEVEITRGAVIQTAPTVGYARLTVTRDLD